MKMDPCFKCDVTGRVSSDKVDVQAYRVFIVKTDEAGVAPIGDLADSDMVVFASPKRDLCPDALHRLIEFNKRGLTPTRTPPDQRGAMLAPPKPEE